MAEARITEFFGETQIREEVLDFMGLGSCMPREAWRLPSPQMLHDKSNDSAKLSAKSSNASENDELDKDNSDSGSSSLSSAASDSDADTSNKDSDSDSSSTKLSNSSRSGSAIIERAMGTHARRSGALGFGLVFPIRSGP